jgi:electron transfer flavoprotein beta subunit
MNIVVCVKQVPDTYAERKLNETDKTLDREGVDGVMNEIDEYAVEEALRLKEANGGEVTILTMGPAKSLESIRKALSMGADKAIHLQDDALHGSDVIQTSAALAKAIGTTEYDLVICGSEATDARMSLMGALLAEQLAIPQLTLARKVTVDGTSITIERQTDSGYDVLSATLPAVISVVEKINEPRYPSFKGIMAAKSKPVTTLSAADAGLDAGSLGLESAGSKVNEFSIRPPRSAGVKVTDEGDGGTKVAEFLASQKLI